MLTVRWVCLWFYLSFDCMFDLFVLLDVKLLVRCFYGLVVY